MIGCQWSPKTDMPGDFIVVLPGPPCARDRMAWSKIVRSIPSPSRAYFSRLTVT